MHTVLCFCVFFGARREGNGNFVDGHGGLRLNLQFLLFLNRISFVLKTIFLRVDRLLIAGEATFQPSTLHSAGSRSHPRPLSAGRLPHTVNHTSIPQIPGPGSRLLARLVFVCLIFLVGGLTLLLLPKQKPLPQPDHPTTHPENMNWNRYEQLLFDDACAALSEFAPKIAHETVIAFCF